MNDSLAELGATLAKVSRQAAEIGRSDDAVAFAFVTDLAGALTGVPALSARVLGLVEVAALGPMTREHVLSRVEELRRAQRDLDADLAALRELRPVLDRLRAAAAERDRVAAELAELQRLERLAAELHHLEAQQGALNDRYEELTSLGAAERKLATSAEAVLTLTTQQLAKLDQRTAETLAAVRQTSQRLAEAKDSLADERARLDRLTTELHAAAEGFAALKEQSERRLPAVEAYRLADQQLLDGIAGGPMHEGSGLDYANSALDDLDRRLADVRAALNGALAAHDAAYDEARALLPVR